VLVVSILCLFYSVSQSMLIRSIIVFQQIGNPEVLLLTAHWESVAQHMEWIGSSVNQDAMPRLEEHIDMSKLLFFHVDGLAAFGPEILQASVVAVSRYFVPRYQKQSVDKAIRGMMSRDDAHSVGKSGWRIEKDQAMERDEVEEHVIVSGADSVEHLKDIEAKSFKAVFSGCGEDIRYYKRVL
jgi:hypothetical protein